MKKTLYLIFCLLFICSASACSSLGAKDDNLQKIIIDYQGANFGSVPEWVITFDKNNKEELVKSFPELNGKIIFATSEKNKNLSYAKTQAKVAIDEEYLTMMEDDILKNIANSNFSETKEMSKNDFAKVCAKNANVIGLEKNTEYWINYKLVDKNTQEELESGFEVFAIYSIDKKRFDENVSNAIKFTE